eukprot:TRINITY_DN1220_c0_g1_i3.p1 TRINITY_DN1220_c0_g1~~TRINITY_DN1220_c0_g1_i3.p1  ORF type:complete len:153 (+),score=2.53 TRINITY_DN1220_c0_g1_i3:90-548(+)
MYRTLVRACLNITKSLDKSQNKYVYHVVRLPTFVSGCEQIVSGIPVLQGYVRWQHCSCPPMSELDSPKLYVEYDPEDVDKFISFADQMEERFPHIIIEGNVEGVEPRSSSFEVSTVDGKLIFSKLSSQRYPEDTEMVQAVESLVVNNQQTQQ